MLTRQRRSDELPDAKSRLTIAESGVLVRGGNSFAFMRLVFAAFVIASHTFPIGGFGLEPLWTLSRHTITIGSLALWGFFALSGALVGMSAASSETARYLWHRSRRILPAYWVCLIVTAFVFAPFIAWVRDLPTTSFTQPLRNSARVYVVSNFTLGIQRLTIGTVLKGLPYPFAMNSSMWSLSYEAACYIIVLGVVRLWAASNQRNLVLGSTLAASVFLAFAANPDARTVFPRPLKTGVDIPLLGPLSPTFLYALLAVFLTGTVIALWRERIWLTPGLTVVATAICLGSIPLGWFIPAGSLALPYAVIGIGYYLPRPFRKIGARNDYSYGLYLYGSPVGQALVAISPTLWSAWSLMLATLVTALGVAAASWFAVERFFLRSPKSPNHPGDRAVGITPRPTHPSP